ncbi:MAG: hypothetical protein QM770_21960 [Tepidisphaeraceae bacterium]
MPAFLHIKCDDCGQESLLLTDGLSVQLDDGSLKHLRHPGEGRDCENLGLTLAQAASRGRLFHNEYSICRSCGERVRSNSRIERYSTSFDCSSEWSFVKFMAIVALCLVPLALWFRWRELAFVVGFTAISSPFIVLNERRKSRLEREREGKPSLPTPDAPGRVVVTPPLDCEPCCLNQDLVPVIKCETLERLRCPQCSRWGARVTGGGIA